MSSKEKKVRGRPWLKLDIELVEKYAAMGMSLADIAKMCGVSLSTLSTRKRVDDLVDEAWTRGVAMNHAKLSERLEKHIDEGNVPALIFKLKVKHGWKETQGVELTGANGGPVDVGFSPLDRLREKMKSYQNALEKAEEGVRPGVVADDSDNGREGPREVDDGGNS